LFAPHAAVSSGRSDSDDHRAGPGRPGSWIVRPKAGVLGGQDVAARPEFEGPYARQDSERYRAQIARKAEDDIGREHL